MVQLPGRSHSIWFDGASAAPTHMAAPERLPSAADVVVAGAGITGLAAAVELAEAGVDVVVIDVRTVAAGASGHSSAKVAVLHELRASEIAESSGEDAAESYVRANRWGFDWIERRVREGAIDCDWRTAPAVTYATTGATIGRVRAEAEALRSAGVDADLERPSLPFSTTAGVRVGDQAAFDPVAFLRGLADAFVAAGGRIVEGVRVLGAETSDDAAVAVTDAGRVRCRWVISATGLPFADRSLLFARAEPESSYVLACEVEEMPPTGMYLSADGAKRSMRPATAPDGGEVLLVGGESHKTGQGGRTIDRYRRLADWTDTHFGLRRVTHRFMTEDFMSADRMPFAGAIAPGSPILVGTGYSKWGFTNGVAAAAVNAAAVLDRSPPAWARYFSAQRLPRSGLGEIASANANVAAHLTGGWLNTFVPRRPPGPGEGRVMGRVVDRVATSVDDAGRTCRVSGVCPHLGAILTWNDAESTWDCPLHGSRFDREGSLLHGPAVTDLRRKD